MKRFVILFVIFISGSSLFAQNANELFSEANDAYKNSEYSHAIQLYEQILESGRYSATLYYNLGNAYFKNNEIGKSILNYERALRINPSDKDIKYNLRIAKSQTVDKHQDRPLLFYERWWQNLYTMHNDTGWSFTGIFSLVVFLSLLVLYLISRSGSRKRIFFYSAIIFFFITTVSFIFARKQYNKQTDKSQAIIMNPRVTAKSSPSAESPDLFLVHEGTKVTIRSSINDWYEVTVQGGNVGWIRKDTFETI